MIEAKTTTTEAHILIFGCNRQRQTFRALVPGPAPRGPASRPVKIRSCPGCGEEHLVIDLLGRPYVPGEQVDAIAERLPKPPKPKPPEAASAARRITTEDILAAVPPTDTPAAEVAAQAGYDSGAGGLLRRISRSAQLQRAIVVTRGKPVLLRRREEDPHEG